MRFICSSLMAGPPFLAGFTGGPLCLQDEQRAVGLGIELLAELALLCLKQGEALLLEMATWRKVHLCFIPFHEMPNDSGMVKFGNT